MARNEIRLESGAGAFLKRGDKYLLIKRALNRKMAPGVWSCVGGHMEPNELCDPVETCLREVQEETGIAPEHIHHFELRYIILRRAGDVIRQNYIYFGETDAKPSLQTGEGELYWIDADKLLDRQFTQTYTEMIRHYCKFPEEKRVIVGVAGNIAGKLYMKWSAVEDFE